MMMTQSHSIIVHYFLISIRYLESATVELTKCSILPDFKPKKTAVIAK